MRTGARRSPLKPLLRIVLVALVGVAHGADSEHAVEPHYATAPAAPTAQSREAAMAKSAGCLDCHTTTDQPTMHASVAVVLGCTDCHGGDPAVRHPKSILEQTKAYNDLLKQAHVLPRYHRADGTASYVRPHSPLCCNARHRFGAFVLKGLVSPFIPV